LEKISQERQTPSHVASDFERPYIAAFGISGGINKQFTCAAQCVVTCDACQSNARTDTRFVSAFKCSRTVSSLGQGNFQISPYCPLVTDITCAYDFRVRHPVVFSIINNMYRSFQSNTPLIFTLPPPWRDSPLVGLGLPPHSRRLLWFLDHTQRHTTFGRTPLDEWLARR